MCVSSGEGGGEGSPPADLSGPRPDGDALWRTVRLAV